MDDLGVPGLRGVVAILGARERGREREDGSQRKRHGQDKHRVRERKRENDGDETTREIIAGF